MKQKFLAAGILFGILAAGWYGCGPGEEKIPEGGHVKLRSTYVALSKENAGEMLKSNGFFERDLNKSGGFGNQYKLSTLPNRKTNLEETVVTDGSTGLMWQQSGSGIPLTYREAGEWLGELNKTGYAGHKDWRLPTLEEAVSLMDNKPNEN
ncbi:MAG: DUF1566 domain-containing protein, partial [bacterium]|nr:DUF1566 domain-containing protein [bacterium]